MLIRTTAAVFSAALLLIACGDNDDEEAPEAAVETQETTDPTTIDVSDRSEPGAEVTTTLGTFEGQIAGLAFWQHPTRAYDSALLATNGPAGLYMIDFEGNILFEQPGDFTAGLDLAYADEGALVAAYDAARDAVAVFVVDPRDRVLAPFFTAPGTVTGVCFANAEDPAAVTMVGIEPDGRMVRIARTGEAAPVREPLSLPPIKDCAGVGRDLYVLDANDRVRLLTLGASPSLSDPIGRSGAIDIAAVMLDEGTAPITLEASGRLRFGDEDVGLVGPRGSALPRTRMIAAGSGNFGGVYRDGVLALLGADNTLSLVPWLGVSNRFDGAAVRTVSPQGETAGTGSELFRSRNLPEEGEFTRPEEPNLDALRNPPSTPPGE
jgi:hypothetical protein